MGKFNKGKKSTQSLKPLLPVKRTNSSTALTSITRVGKQSKFGAHKGKATPGQHWNNARNLGGK